ncbi:MAG: ParB N-terminal domain-containing protein [Tabrizicola sp.]|nr:ParB N-terminal domain-containing protein [Tabrizicola sp.]
MVERMPSITDLPIAEIVVPKDRLRPVSEAKVAALMQVIGEGVFLGAITVRRSGKVNTLIDGAHRLEAMRRLERETIPADVLTCNAGEARRMEITGNITAGMTPIQDAIFLGVYQAEYEKLHPETKRGVVGALAKHGLQAANLQFADLVAETRQITPGQVVRIISAGRKLSSDEREALQAAPHRIAMSEIEKLGKIGDQPLRALAVEALLEGKKVAAALKAAKGEAPVKDPVEEAFIALSKAWARAPMAAKKRFLINHRHDIWDAEDRGEPLANFLDPEGGEK